MSRRNAQRGFTFPEMLVAAAGLMIVGGVLLMVYLSTINTITIVTAKASVTTQLQAAVEQIGRDVHIARSRLTTCGTVTADNTILILEAPGIGGAGVDHILYRNNGGTLERTLQNVNCTLADPVRRQLARTITPVHPDTFWTGILFLPFPFNITTQRYVETHLELRSGTGITASGKLVVRHNLRNP